jgi:hypothetical protein
LIKYAVLVKIEALKAWTKSAKEVKLLVVGPASEFVARARHFFVCRTLVPAEVFETESMQVIGVVAVSMESGKDVPVVVEN